MLSYHKQFLLVALEDEVADPQGHQLLAVGYGGGTGHDAVALRRSPRIKASTTQGIQPRGSRRMRHFFIALCVPQESSIW